MNRRAYLDLLERTLWTFVQAFAASMLIVGFDDWANGLKISAAAGAAAVLKGFVAMNVGESKSPAALPGARG